MTPYQPHRHPPANRPAGPPIFADHLPPEPDHPGPDTTAAPAGHHEPDPPRPAGTGVELMTPVEVRRLLKVTKDWLYDQVEAQRIPHIRLGRHLRFRLTDL